MDWLHKPLIQWNLVDYAIFCAGFLLVVLVGIVLFERLSRRPK